jgi:cell division septation protein DedD
MNHKQYALIVTILVAASVLASSTQAAVIPYDKTGSVTSVISGNTFTLNTGETVKLAEITVPANGEAGFETSRSYLASIIEGKTVYLDSDTLIRTDGGKFLCVAYIDFNTTHYENINQAMIEARYAAPTTTQTTEFTPSSWTWFIAKQTATPTPTPTPAPTATITASPTPFSAPTPSISPDASTPTATPTQTSPATTLTAENGAIALSQTWIIIAAAAIIVAAILVIVFVLKRRK